MSNRWGNWDPRSGSDPPGGYAQYEGDPVFHKHMVACDQYQGAVPRVRYTAKFVQDAVEKDVERLFTPWAVGRPENWKPDPATKMLISTGYWIAEELKKICKNDADIRTQQGAYNRLSRTYDIYETAAEVLNDALDGNIDQNRRGHKRWG